MYLLEGLKTRRSIRSYEERDIPDSVIEELLDTARWAPSAANNQPWRFIVVKDRTRKEALRGGFTRKMVPLNRQIREAPVLLVAWYEPSLVLGKYQVSDVSCAILYVMLAAHARGLGTCWIGWFSEGVVKKVAHLPTSARVVALITLGYPREIPEPRKRNPVGDIVFRETYPTSWLSESE